MPVRYDIAAGVPQAQGGGFDPMNAFAQMQAMSYRQQQNALAQAQLEEYQRQRQEEEGLRNYMAQKGIDPMSNEFMARVAGISPKYLPGLMSARAGAQRDIRAGELSAAQIPGVMSETKKKQIEESLANLTRLQTVAANVLQRNGEGFEDLKNLGQGGQWKSLIGDKYDEKRIRALATQAATAQKFLEPQIAEVGGEKVQLQPSLVPGKAPVLTPAVVAAPEDMISAPTVYAPGKEPSIGRLVTEGLPGERKPPEVLTQKQYRELPGRQESSKIYGELSGLFQNLAERKAMPSVAMTPFESLRAVSAGSRAGQEVARVLDPESQRIRDEASSLIDQWIQTKRQSGNISAQEANTIEELERLKSMLGNPRMSNEAVQNILARADKYSGLGKLKGYEPTDQEKKGVIDARKLTTGNGAERPPLASFFGK